MTDPNSASYTAPPRGATKSEQRRRRTPWWLWLLLGLLALAALTFGLSQCGTGARPRRARRPRGAPPRRVRPTPVQPPPDPGRTPAARPGRRPQAAPARARAGPGC
jgi:hypothetical protein